MDEQFTFKATGLTMPPSYTICFHKDGKQIGVLDFNGPAMVFTGDAEESAMVFMDHVARVFKGRLKQERMLGAEQGVPVWDPETNTWTGDRPTAAPAQMTQGSDAAPQAGDTGQRLPPAS